MADENIQEATAKLNNVTKELVDRLKAEADLANTRMNLAKQAMDALQSQLNSVSDEISEREATIQQATERRALIDQERSVLSQFIEAKKIQVEAAREDTSYTRSALSAAQNELSASKDRLAAYRAQEDSIQSIIDANNEEARKLKGSGEFRGRGPQKKVSPEEQERVSILKAANEEHLRRFNELKEARMAEVAYGSSMRSAVGQLENELSEKQGVQDALQGEYDTATSEMAQLNKQRMFERTKIVEATNGLDELRNAQKELTDNLEDASKAYENAAAVDVAKQNNLTNAKSKLFQKATANASAKLQKIAKVLIDLEKTIRDTQQQFGISAGQAANVKFGQLQESITSTFNSLTTLGRDARVSMEEIQAAQVAFQKEFGGVISTGAAAELAEQAKELGISVTDMANARRAFLTTTLGDVNSAITQQERAIASFEEKGLTAKDAMEFVGKNAELVARAGTRFQDSLMKAAATAKKIGVDLSKVNQVGDNIIGDFEGFLESMAELGAMGFGLDATRLAEIAETGDTSALMNELSSQLAMTGKDLTDLRRSEQLALSQAFGMDIGEFQRLAGLGMGEEPTGGGESMEDLQKKSNELLTRIVNLLGPVGLIAGGISTLIGKFSGDLFKNIKFGNLDKIFNVGISRFLTSGIRLIGNLVKNIPGAGMAARAGRAVLGRAGGIGGAGGIIAGGIGAVQGFMKGREQGQGVTRAAGSGLAQGGAAAAGAIAGGALGSFLGPIGTAIGATLGGWLGNNIGKYINEKLPAVGAAFGGFIDGFIKGLQPLITMVKSLKGNFTNLWSALEPLRKTIEEWTGSGEIDWLTTTFKVLGSVIGFIVTGPLTLLVAGLNLFAIGLTAIFEFFQDPSAALGNLKNAIISTFGSIINWIIDKINILPGIDIPNVGGETQTGDDVVSRPGYGDRTLVTQQGAIALNNQDNVVAYADDMISRAAAGITMLSKGALTQQSEAPVNNINVDMSALEKKLDQVVQAIGAMKVNLDGNRVGEVLVSSEQRASLSGVFRATRVTG